MRFTSAFIAGSLAIAARAQSTTASEEATPTFALDPVQSSILACIDECDPTDTECLARCNPVPNPNEDQANDTTACVADCEQGNGTEAETQAYADCIAVCINDNFFGTTGGTPSPTGAPSNDDSGDESTTEESGDVVTTASDATNSLAPTDSSSESDAEETGAEETGAEETSDPSGTSEGGAEETGTEEDAASTLLGASTALLAVFAAVMAL